MHAPNKTNLHTHGLHIDPGVDTIFFEAGPGESLVYNYKLPLNHASGLHWYHAHRHGSSTMQIMGGLFGALIVDPLPSSMTIASPEYHHENLPDSLSICPSHLLVLSQFIYTQETVDGQVSQGCGNDYGCNATWQVPGCSLTDSMTPSPFSPFRQYSYPELTLETYSKLDGTVDLMTVGIETEAYLLFVNGQYQPTLDITAASSTIFDILIATGADEIELEIIGCDIFILGYDGVYLDAKISQSQIKLVAASRVTLEVICNNPGNYVLKSRNLDVMIFNANSGTPISPVLDAELAAINRPAYLSDLRSVPAEDYYSVHMSQGSRDTSVCGFWFGAGSDCSAVAPWGSNQPSATNPDCPFSPFQGERGLDPATYLSANKLVTTMGKVNEWTLYGLGNSHHPLHIHVNHIQIISFEEDGSTDSQGTSAFFLPGQWRDTVPSFQGKLTFRFRPSDFTGEHVLHCHFLRHEDLGMMDTFLVVAPDPEPSTSTDSPVSLPTAVPTESLPAASSVPTAAPTGFVPTAASNTPVSSPVSSPAEVPTSSELPPNCYILENPQWLGDGYCDKEGPYNTAECEWDRGDCCESTCNDGISNCGIAGFDCKDPNIAAAPMHNDGTALCGLVHSTNMHNVANDWTCKGAVPNTAPCGDMQHPPWSGVKCDPETGRVKEVSWQFTDYFVQGHIDSSIRHLTEVTYLDFHHQLLKGPIEPELGNLPKLHYLDLSVNQFTGKLPKTFRNLKDRGADFRVRGNDLDNHQKHH